MGMLTHSYCRKPKTLCLALTARCFCQIVILITPAWCAYVKSSSLTSLRLADGSSPVQGKSVARMASMNCTDNNTAQPLAHSTNDWSPFCLTLYSWKFLSLSLNICFISENLPMSIQSLSLFSCLYSLVNTHFFYWLVVMLNITKQEEKLVFLLSRKKSTELTRTMYSN